MLEKHKSMAGLRIITALNSVELFGQERGNIEAYKIFRELGADVVVGVNALPDNKVKIELGRLGFSTFDLPFEAQWSIRRLKKNPLIAVSNLLAVLRCSWIFHRVMQEFAPTHIHLGSPLVYSYLSLALSFTGIPLIYRMGDCPPVDSPFNLRIWQMAMRRTSWVVANSKFVLNSAVSSGVCKNKISIINNLAPSSANQCIPTKNSINKSNMESLLYVGAVSEHKGLVPLIEAFAQLKDSYPSLRLEIVGWSRYDAPFRNRLLDMVAELKLENRILFLGHQDNPSFFFGRALIHVAPSIWEEPFANVVLEAKREGVPSVVFPSGGLPEMVRHKIDGFVCRDKSVEALVEGLSWMLSDADRLIRMRSAAKGDSIARFGRQRFAREWASVYLFNCLTVN